VLRTSIAQKIIPDYPEEVLESSILFDAVVNLFDDLIDEVLKRKQKQLILIELIRLIALLNRKSFPDKIRNRVSIFFHKGIVIAVSEQIFLQQLTKTLNNNEQLKFAIQTYDCRSLVIDIFF